VTDFIEADLRGARFQDVHLGGAVFQMVTFEGARLSEVDLSGVRIRGAWLRDLELTGEVERLTVNGINERSWEATVARARRLPEELLHERVDGEWSFIETLRHLVFCTDAWLRRALLGEPSPWSPLDLPHDEMPDLPGVPRDRDARPGLDQVLALRADRMAGVREVVAGLTDEQLEGSTEPVLEPGYPESESFPVRRCFQAVVDEEWQHRWFAERDLAVLESTRSR